MSSPDPESVAPESRPWGFWMTCALSAALFAVYVAGQAGASIALAVFRALRDPGFNIDAYYANIGTDGFAHTVMVLACLPINLGALFIAARLRRGIRLADYFALHPVSWARLGAWLAVLMILTTGIDLLKYAVGLPVLPDFMLQVDATARSRILLWIALALGAPLFEEGLFRGFLFTGLRASPLGATGAIGLSAAVWAAVHLQYEVWDMAYVLVIGVTLGIARHRSGSLYPPLAMHGLMNLTASVEVALYNTWTT